MYVVDGGAPESNGSCPECGQLNTVRDYRVVSASGKELFAGPLCDDCVQRWTISPLSFETLLR